jgi:site-specific recombinase XerD
MSATTFMSAGGPLVPYAAGYRQWLAGQGYLPGPVRRQLRLFAHLSGWLAVSGAGMDALAGERLAEYAAVRRADGQFLYSARALAPLLRYLRELGVLPEVAASCRELSVPAAKQMVSALRALLRFLHVSGVTGRELAGAVPGVPGWSLSHLPKGLRPAEVAGLLGVCDRTARTGLRDYAVLCLLSRLGLRAGEIAALSLQDVDWRQGELLVRGKGRREERLPLPADVGAALAGYVRSGRPAGQRELFLRVRAPSGPLGRSGVSAIVVRAGRAAGIAGAGAHRLRHSVATDLLGQGATLAEVGQVLRHSSASSTAIYANPRELHRMSEVWTVCRVRSVSESFPAGRATRCVARVLAPASR